jgi:hypothetical protein
MEGASAMISRYPHPNDPDYDHSDWERAVEQADWESRIEAHLRPPCFDDYDGHCEFMEAE